MTVGLTEPERMEYEASWHKIAIWLKGFGTACAFEFMHVGFTVSSMTKLLEQDVGGILLLVPKLATWSRLLQADATGPRPFRTKACPWGAPWAEGAARQRIEEENELVRMSIKLVEQFTDRHGGSALFMVAAEDLGKGALGTPASLWQLRGFKRIARRRGLRRMAFHQCHLGDSAWPRPTGVLATHALPPRTSRLGWPTVDRARDSKYNGPLGPSCKCGREHVTMLKKGGEYKSPIRNLSESSLQMLAAAAINAAIYEEASVSSAAERLLKEGVDVYKALRGDNWVPESEVPADQTEDEDALLPPVSSASEDEGSTSGLDEDFGERHRDLHLSGERHRELPLSGEGRGAQLRVPHVQAAGVFEAARQQEQTRVRPYVKFRSKHLNMNGDVQGLVEGQSRGQR